MPPRRREGEPPDGHPGAGHRAWATTVPGALAAAIAALAAQRLGIWFNLPAALLAVAVGLAAAALPGKEALGPGLHLWAKPGLRLGVAMMGAGVAWTELIGLGAMATAAGGLIVFIGLTAGAGIGLLLGLPLAEAVIAACAVSICGASAAMAVAQVAPSSTSTAQQTALVVVGVNLLSTLAMLTYPLLTHALGLSAVQSGLFFGLSIHDVAQVAGAGASVSPEAATAATLAKLGRIRWLGPAVMLAGAAMARAAAGRSTKLVAPPLFVWGFMGLAALRGMDLLPQPLLPSIAQASSLLLLGGGFAVTASLAPPRDRQRTA